MLSSPSCLPACLLVVLSVFIRYVFVSFHFFFFSYQENLHARLTADLHLNRPKVAAQRESGKPAWTWPKKETSLKINYRRFDRVMVVDWTK
jgi:hypothetical protein